MRLLEEARRFQTLSWEAPPWLGASRVKAAWVATFGLLAFRPPNRARCEFKGSEETVAYPLNTRRRPMPRPNPPPPSAEDAGGWGGRLT